MKLVINNIKEKLKHQKVIVACSTGVDSMTLLNIVMKAKPCEEIIVAHVNHKKREQSEEEEKYIKHFCEQNKIKCYILHLDHTENGNFQSIAREKRYNFFIEIAEKEQCEYILLAHHANDNLETIIMRMLKSSSLKGYAGIEEETLYKGKILYRPLLKLSKELIVSYANENNIKYYEDESNGHLDYTRNRIRHLITPILLEENPNLYEAINYYSDTLHEASQIIEKMEIDFISNNVDKTNINNKITYTININDYITLSDYLKKQILFRLLKKYNLSHNCIEEIMKKINSSKNTVVSKLNNEVSLIKEHNKIIFTELNIDKSSFYLRIEKEGRYKLLNDVEMIVDKNNCYFLPTTTKLCYNIKSLPIIVRTREAGDKINNKLISDYLTKLKIPYMEKKDILLLCNNENKIIAIIGYEGGKKCLK